MGWKNALERMVGGAKDVGRAAKQVATRVAEGAKDEVNKAIEQKKEERSKYVANCTLIGEYFYLRIKKNVKKGEELVITEFGKQKTDGLEKYLPGIIRDDVQEIKVGERVLAFIDHTHQRVISYDLETKKAVDAALGSFAKQNPAKTTYKSEYKQPVD